MNTTTYVFVEKKEKYFTGYPLLSRPMLSLCKLIVNQLLYRLIWAQLLETNDIVS